MTKRLDVPLAQVIADKRYQPRVEMDSSIVAEYAEQMAAGDVFPPIRVIRLASDGKLYIADGFHRYYAAKKLKHQTIAAEIVKDNGTHTDILLECVKANNTHGLRRTNEDKHRAIEMILSEPAFAKLGNRRISELALVSKSMVIDFKRRAAGELTRYEKEGKPTSAPGKGVGTTQGTPSTTTSNANLTKAQKAVKAHMEAAGTPPAYIDETLALWASENAKRKQSPPVKRKTDIERLEALADRLARSKNVIIELAVKDATPRTKQYVKLPNSLKRKVKGRG
jgi:uncharacterized ParB-like nuclease family protein